MFFCVNINEKGLKMENNIACCYLTHNHPDIVEAVLEINLEYYKKNGIDVYMYDSSTDGRTKEIIDNKIKQGADNLFYIKIDDKIGGDGKMFEVLKRYGIQKKYDYIWPNKDRSYVTEKTVQNIRKASINMHECIFIDQWLPIETDRRKYKSVYDKEEFFYEFGWMTTSWEAVLLSTKMLDRIKDWGSIEKKFQLGLRNAFNQVIVLFYGLTLIENARVEVLDYKEAELKNYPSSGSAWIPYTFDTWGKRWPKAIRSLPACYNEYKEKVIKDQGMHPIVFGSIDNLIALKERGIFTREKWNEVKDDWNILSDIPKKDAEAILDGKYDWLIQDVYNALNFSLKEGENDKAYFIFSRTSYLKVLFSNKSYWMLKTCFDIYLAEVHNRKEPGIMYHVKSCDDLLYKYHILKYFVRRLEYDIPIEDDIVAFCRNNHVTTECLVAIITRETINKDKVIEGIEKIFAGK